MPRLLIFKVGPHRCGVDMNLVAGITNSDRQLDRWPEAQFRCEIHIEGAEQPVYNLPRVFNRTHAPKENGFRKIVRTKVDGQRLNFIVDEVFDDLAIEKQVPKSLPPIFNGNMRKCFPEILSHEGEPIMVADPVALARLADDLQASLPNNQEMQVSTKSNTDDRSNSIPLEPITEYESDSIHLRKVPETGSTDTDREKISPEADNQKAEFVDDDEENHTKEQLTRATNVEIGFPIEWNRVENALQRLLAVKLAKLLRNTAPDSAIEFPDGCETWEKSIQRLVALKMRYLLSRVLEETA